IARNNFLLNALLEYARAIGRAINESQGHVLPVWMWAVRSLRCIAREFGLQAAVKALLSSGCVSQSTKNGAGPVFYVSGNQAARAFLLALRRRGFLKIGKRLPELFLFLAYVSHVHERLDQHKGTGGGACFPDRERCLAETLCLA